jgi:aspartate oxidase
MMAKLTELSRDSVARLNAIEGLIPHGLRASIKAGPIEGNAWCLLLDNNATASKIKQLLPAIQAHLRSKGWEVNSIRLKVQPSRDYKMG